MGKKKKEKVVYVDDGRTLADMSGVGGPRLSRKPGQVSSSMHDQWQTYKVAVKMMVRPMLVVITAMTIVYLVFYLLLIT